MQVAVQSVVEQAEVNGPAVIATTAAGDVISARRVSALGGTELEVAAPGGGTAGVAFPASLDGQATVAVVAYASSPHPEPKPSFPRTQEGGELVSGVVEVTVNFTVSDLLEPVIIHLPRSESGEVCKWWDVDAGDWSADGCVWLGGACACTHLTMFAACRTFYECSTLSIVSQFPEYWEMFWVYFRPVSLLPLLLGAALIVMLAEAVLLDAKHRYYSHLSSVFFVDTPKPTPLTIRQKLHKVFVELHHPTTKLVAILQGADPIVVLVNRAQHTKIKHS